MEPRFPETAPRISFIKGGFIIAQNLKDVKIFEIVQLGYGKLIGEIIGQDKNGTYIQAYEDASRLSINDPVYQTNHFFLAKLGPGIFNGTQENETMQDGKKWNFLPRLFKGSKITPGDILGEVKETPSVSLQIMAPLSTQGVLTEIKSGNFLLNEPISKIRAEEALVSVVMQQSWPVRFERPYQEKISAEPELISAHNILDSIFYGDFNHTNEAEKNIMQRQVAKWAEADVIIPVLRKENLPKFLNKFNEFRDLKNKRPLTDKTLFLVNEAPSPYARDMFMDKAITTAEYFRDMGYNAILIIDSMNDWKKDLDVMIKSCHNRTSYYSSRLKNFFARAGRVKCLGKDSRTGSVVVMGGE